MEQLPTKCVTRKGDSLLAFFEQMFNYGSHILRKYTEKCDKFLKLSPKDMKEMTFMYLEATKYIITHCFISTIIYDKNQCEYFPSVIIDNENTIGKVFDKGYLNMLKALLDSTWNEGYENAPQNTISINGVDITSIKTAKDIKKVLGKGVSNAKIAIKKAYLNAFIAHFLKNSLDPVCGGGHRGQYEEKNISIEINKHSIRISDVVTVEFYSQSGKEVRAKKFESIKNDIVNGRFDFDHKTIFSFMGLINFMNYHDEENNYKFEFGFNDEGNFFVELRY